MTDTTTPCAPGTGRTFQVSLCAAVATMIAGCMGNTPVPENSSAFDMRVPDPLIPLMNPYEGGNLGQPFDVPAEQSQPVWLDVYIPEGTPAGTYTGTVTVTEVE